LVYDVTGLERAKTGRVRLIVEKFAGGGFAGQVYKVKILKIDTTAGPINGLEEGRIYAMKILIPPTTFSRLFRNTLYRVGFQGPFQIQVNPAAARAGALWQKFIRRTAKLKFGDENIVADIHATFTSGLPQTLAKTNKNRQRKTWFT
jgi:hypothetical protein